MFITLGRSENIFKDSHNANILDLETFSIDSLKKLQNVEIDSNIICTGISRIYDYKNEVVIFSKLQQQVFISDSKGRLFKFITLKDLKLLPGQKIEDFFINTLTDNLVFLISGSENKILNTDFAGIPFSQTILSHRYKELKISGNYIYLLSYPNETSNLAQLFVIDRLANKTHLLTEQYISTKFEMSSQSRELISIGNCLYYTRLFDNTIYSIKEFMIRPICTINLGNYVLPENDLLYSKSLSDFLEDCKVNNYVYSLNKIANTEKYIFINTNNSNTICYSKQKHISKILTALDGFDSIESTINYFPMEGEGNRVAFLFKNNDKGTSMVICE